jgi:hypothetical protein
MFCPCFVTDFRRCWRSKAMRLLALGGAIQGAMVAMPAAVSDHLPAWVMSTGSTISFLCLVAAGLGIGKETRPEQNDVRNPNP